jgi:hypothetical protein
MVTITPRVIGVEPESSHETRTIEIVNPHPSNFVLFKIRRDEPKLVSFHPKAGLLEPLNSTKISLEFVDHDSTFGIRAGRLVVKTVELEKHELVSDFRVSWELGASKCEASKKIVKFVSVADATGALDESTRMRNEYEGKAQAAPLDSLDVAIDYSHHDSSQRQNSPARFSTRSPERKFESEGNEEVRHQVAHLSSLRVMRQDNDDHNSNSDSEVMRPNVIENGDSVAPQSQHGYERSTLSGGHDGTSPLPPTRPPIMPRETSHSPSRQRNRNSKISTKLSSTQSDAELAQESSQVADQCSRVVDLGQSDVQILVEGVHATNENVFRTLVERITTCAKEEKYPMSISVRDAPMTSLFHSIGRLGALAVRTTSMKQLLESEPAKVNQPSIALSLSKINKRVIQQRATVSRMHSHSNKEQRFSRHLGTESSFKIGSPRSHERKHFSSSPSSSSRDIGHISLLSTIDPLVSTEAPLNNSMDTAGSWSQWQKLLEHAMDDNNDHIVDDSQQLSGPSQVADLQKIVSITHLAVTWSSLQSLDESLNAFQCLTSLDVSNNEISCMEGLISLPFLKHLNLSCNRLRSLDFLQPLLKLESLKASRNQLETINCSLNMLVPIAQSIKCLDLSYNSVSIQPNYVDVTLSVCKNLEVFDTRVLSQFRNSYENYSRTRDDWENSFMDITCTDPAVYVEQQRMSRNFDRSEIVSAAGEQAFWERNAAMIDVRLRRNLKRKTLQPQNKELHTVKHNARPFMPTTLFSAVKVRETESHANLPRRRALSKDLYPDTYSKSHTIDNKENTSETENMHNESRRKSLSGILFGRRTGESVEITKQRNVLGSTLPTQVQAKVTIDLNLSRSCSPKKMTQLLEGGSWRSPSVSLMVKEVLEKSRRSSRRGSFAQAQSGRDPAGHSTSQHFDLSPDRYAVRDLFNDKSAIKWSESSPYRSRSASPRRRTTHINMDHSKSESGRSPRQQRESSNRTDGDAREKGMGALENLVARRANAQMEAIEKSYLLNSNSSGGIAVHRPQNVVTFTAASSPEERLEWHVAQAQKSLPALQAIMDQSPERFGGVQRSRPGSPPKSMAITKDAEPGRAKKTHRGPERQSSYEPVVNARSQIGVLFQRAREAIDQPSSADSFDEHSISVQQQRDEGQPTTSVFSSDPSCDAPASVLNHSQPPAVGVNDHAPSSPMWSSSENALKLPGHLFVEGVMSQLDEIEEIHKGLEEIARARQNADKSESDSEASPTQVHDSGTNEATPASKSNKESLVSPFTPNLAILREPTERKDTEENIPSSPTTGVQHTLDDCPDDGALARYLNWRSEQISTKSPSQNVKRCIFGDEKNNEEEEEEIAEEEDDSGASTDSFYTEEELNDGQIPDPSNISPFSSAMHPQDIALRVDRESPESPKGRNPLGPILGRPGSSL